MHNQDHFQTRRTTFPRQIPKVYLLFFTSLTGGRDFFTSSLIYFNSVLSTIIVAFNVFFCPASNWCWKIILQHNLTSTSYAQKHGIGPCADIIQVKLFFKILLYMKPNSYTQSHNTALILNTLYLSLFSEHNPHSPISMLPTHQYKFPSHFW